MYKSKTLALAENAIEDAHVILPGHPKVTLETAWDGRIGGNYVVKPDKVVLHTTETNGMPDYNGGIYAPHMTYHPHRKVLRLHTPLHVAASAMRNKPGGVQTNLLGAIQIEIVAYSDEDLARKRGGLAISKLSEADLVFLRELFDHLARNYRIPLVRPANVANSPRKNVRFTEEEWLEFRGFCGHQHVPENDHWDPGAFPWHAFALTTVGKEPTMSGINTLTEEEATVIQRMLTFLNQDISYGGFDGVDGKLGPRSKAALAPALAELEATVDRLLDDRSGHMNDTYVDELKNYLTLRGVEGFEAGVRLDHEEYRKVKELVEEGLILQGVLKSLAPAVKRAL